MPNVKNQETLSKIKEDLDGVSAMVRQVEGVLLGFTLREREGHPGVARGHPRIRRQHEGV